MERDYILAEIRRTAVANGGKALGRRRFEAETGIRASDWEPFWARFGDAVAEAGLARNTLQAAFSDDHLMTKLAELVRDLGRIPAYSEIRQRSHVQPDFPNAKVFQRLGPKAAVLAKLKEFCGRSDDWADVAELCRGVDARPARSTPAKTTPDVVLGSVYLLRSGRHFKIGRSNHAGRRERELAIQLPERARMVHEIKTDDPPGIEAYWHKRFADRRGNGEWFSLTPEDVRAFRRRKFM